METALSLFSGGLDSILATRLVMDQGISVRCLHFVSPFFGKPEEIAHWEKSYGFSIETVDIGSDFVQLLQKGPMYGYGKVMNPCIDCKILLMRRAKKILLECGAKMLVSGEVIGQRPMSQRRDTLSIITRDADVTDYLIRPLSAKLLPPTPMELSGLIDRTRLGSLSGRGRKGQIALATEMGITDIPTPAGGCRLDERENVRRYWPVLKRLENPRTLDFDLSNIGRQFWRDNVWLCIGRNEIDNMNLAKMLNWNPEIRRFSFSQEIFGPHTALLFVADLPGPLAFLRFLGHEKPSLTAENPILQEAAALVASYMPKLAGHEIIVSCLPAGGIIPKMIKVIPSRETSFVAGGVNFDEIKELLKGHRHNENCRTTSKA